MSLRRIAPALVMMLTLLLSSCRGKETTAPLAVSGALQSLGPAVFLMLAGSLARPAPLMGPYVASFLMGTSASAYRSAVQGVDAIVQMLPTSQEQRDETFALLQELGSALEVDIPDMLNRSTSREQTLDEYLTTLEQLLEDGQEKVGELEDRREANRLEERDARDRLSDVRAGLNEALRAQDYATAGARQEQLTQQQAILDRLQTQGDELRSALRLFDDLIEVGKQRWTAITENREVLLAGLRVVEVPGIEDIGVFEEETREGRRERERESESLFGPTN